MRRCVVLALSAVALCLGFVEQASAQSSPVLTWTSKATMPTARCCLDLVPYRDGKLYAIGGGGEGNVLPIRSAVEAYDPLQNAWTARNAMPTARSFPAGTVGIDGKIYVVGGFTLSSYLSTVEAYDPLANTWTTRQSMPTPRAGFGLAAAPNGKLYAVGGFNGSQWLTTNDAYDPLTDAWTPRQPMLTPREHFGFAAAPDGLLYAVGGGNGPLLASTETYNPTTDRWSPVASMPAARWAFGFTLPPNGKFYVIGGNGGGGAGAGNLNTTLEFDPVQNVWTPRENMLTPRQALAAATGADGALYAVGGSVGNPELGTGANEQATIAGVPIGGSGCGLTCPPPPPPPGQTPELGSLTLFGSALLSALAYRLSGAEQQVQLVLQVTDLRFEHLTMDKTAPLPHVLTDLAAVAVPHHAAIRDRAPVGPRLRVDLVSLENGCKRLTTPRRRGHVEHEVLKYVGFLYSLSHTFLLWRRRRS